MKKLILFSLIFCCFLAKHPFYLGVTDLKFNTNNKHLEGTVRVFSSDLESALKLILKKQVDLIHPKNTEETKKMLGDYLSKRLKIRVNNKPIPYEVIGFEMEEESLWMYVETGECPVPKNIEVFNSILYDYLKEQMNIVNVEVNGAKRIGKLNYPDIKLQFEF